ncbi:unnamed protein product [Rhodiola kirilowii]
MTRIVHRLDGYIDGQRQGLKVGPWASGPLTSYNTKTWTAKISGLVSRSLGEP